MATVIATTIFTTIILQQCLCDWVEIPQLNIKTASIAEPKKEIRKNFENFYTTKPPLILLTTEKTEERAEKLTSRNSENDEFYENSKQYMPSFMNIIESVQKTLIQTKEKKNSKSKIELLENIKNNLLLNIEQKINKLWGSKNTEGESRTFKDKEGYSDHDSGHMDFPSNAAALLTLSFLTFAVYLIKLVLLVVQVFKQNSNQNTNQPFKRQRRNAKYEDIENTERILNLVESFTFK